MTARRRHLLALASFALAFLVGALVYLAGGLSSLEAAALQTRFELRHRPRPNDIVVVGIDDNSLRELGRYPFSRLLDAAAVDRIHTDGARSIAYDVAFTSSTTARADAALFNSIGRAGGATMATVSVRRGGQTNVFGGNQNLALIHSNAGYSAFPITSGGIVERMRYEHDGLTSFAVVTAERASGHSVSQAPFGSDGALIDYQGPRGTFPMISFADVADRRVRPQRLRGKIVVIGATSQLLQDRHATPAGSGLMSGPELQANAIWTVLHGFPLADVPRLVGLLLIALLSAAAPVARLRWATAACALVALAVGIVYAVVTQLVFDTGVVLPVVPPLLALIVGTAGTVTTSELIAASERRRLARELTEAHLELIHRLLEAAESRDQHTGEHLERIGRLTRILALAAGMSPAEAEMLGHASLMHDIGKIGIPDAVLLKSGPLEPDERQVMNTHTTIGGDILSGSHSALVRMAEDVARSHHEHWDGSGYPAGLKGDEIPLAGRICSVCDVFDALVTARTYKPAWTVEEAIAELRRLSGHAFDPQLVELFIALTPSLDRDLLTPSFLPDSEAVVVPEQLVGVPGREVGDQHERYDQAGDERGSQSDSASR